jgi:hypothetical protein
MGIKGGADRAGEQGQRRGRGHLVGRRYARPSMAPVAVDVVTS